MLALLLLLAPAEAKKLKFPEELASAEVTGELGILVEGLFYGKERFDVVLRLRNRNERASILLAGDFRCGRATATLPLLPGHLNGLVGDIGDGDYGVVTSPTKEADEDYPSASSLLRRIDHLVELSPGQERTLSLVCRHPKGETGAFVVTLGRVFHTSPDDMAVPIDLRLELPEAVE